MHRTKFWNRFITILFMSFHDFRLTVIPSDMSQCPKLHAFNYAENKLSDKRLARMMDQCSTKAVLGRCLASHTTLYINGMCAIILQYSPHSYSLHIKLSFQIIWGKYMTRNILRNVARERVRSRRKAKVRYFLTRSRQHSW